MKVIEMNNTKVDKKLIELSEIVSLIRAYIDDETIVLNFPRIALGLNKQGFDMGSIFRVLKVNFDQLSDSKRLLRDIAEAYCTEFQNSLNREFEWRQYHSSAGYVNEDDYLSKKGQISKLLSNYYQLQQEGIALLDSIDKADNSRMQNIQSYWTISPFIDGSIKSEDLAKIVGQIDFLRTLTKEVWEIGRESKPHLTSPQPIETNDLLNGHHKERKHSYEDSPNVAESSLAEIILKKPSTKVEINIPIRIIAVSLCVLFMAIAIKLASEFFKNLSPSNPTENEAPSNKFDDLKTNDEKLKRLLERSAKNNQTLMESNGGHKQAAEDRPNNDSLIPRLSKLDTPNNEQSSDLLLRKKPAIYTYYYRGTCNDAPAQSSEQLDEICVDFQQYKDLCFRARDYTLQSLRVGSVWLSEADKNIVKSNNITNSSTRWVTNRKGRELCYASIEFSGIVDGNTRNVEIFGQVVSFYISESGKVAVHQFVSTYTQE